MSELREREKRRWDDQKMHNLEWYISKCKIESGIIMEDHPYGLGVIHIDKYFSNDS